MNTSFNEDSDTGSTLPESESAPIAYARLGPRAAAALLDSVILLPLVIMGAVVDTLWPSISSWAAIPLLSLGMGYFIYCHGRWGQTPGKRAVRIQLRQATGAPVTWRQAWWRSSVDILLIAIGFAAEILSHPHDGTAPFSRTLEGVSAGSDIGYFLWMVGKVVVHLMDKRRRAIHDLLAGTVVVQLECARLSQRVSWILAPVVALTLLAALAPIIAANVLHRNEVLRIHQMRTNLLLIDNAKDMWALETGARPDAEPTPDDLERYFIDAKFPEPVAGETYVIHPLGSHSVARLNSQVAGNPPGTIIDGLWTSEVKGNVRPFAMPPDHGRSYPERHEAAPPECIDLTRYYNARLRDAWHFADGNGGSLQDLPSDLPRFGGVLFDVRGLIQLSDKRADIQFPHDVQGIDINQKARRLHFLHATGWVVPDGTVIGKYVIHFADNLTEEIPIVYGTHLREWHGRSDQTSAITSGTLAWETEVGPRRIYRSTWTNTKVIPLSMRRSTIRGLGTCLTAI
ncbi:MAG: RDD family protein, partial [Verrucomicrobia bacterium]|nr:RDD family protein [Verrucomicrobiota bacterium]